MDKYSCRRKLHNYIPIFEKTVVTYTLTANAKAFYRPACVCGWKAQFSSQTYYLCFQAYRFYLWKHEGVPFNIAYKLAKDKYGTLAKFSDPEEP